MEQIIALLTQKIEEMDKERVVLLARHEKELVTLEAKQEAYYEVRADFVTQYEAQVSVPVEETTESS